MLKIPFYKPSIGNEEINEVVDTLKSGWLTTGAKTKQFEREFADYVKHKHAIAVNSCTAALHLALEAIGIKAGQSVVVPTMTFAATAEVVRYFGARPLLVDCRVEDFNLDVADAERRIQSALADGRAVPAIMPVHYGGLVGDVEGVAALAKRYQLKIVEDAAHCCPSYYRDHRTTGRQDYETTRLRDCETTGPLTTDQGSGEQGAGSAKRGGGEGKAEKLKSEMLKLESGGGKGKAETLKTEMLKLESGNAEGGGLKGKAEKLKSERLKGPTFDAQRSTRNYGADGWKAVGASADITCFSFYANKCITTGEGGMACTQNDDYADRMRIMSLHGISKDAWKRFTAEGSWYYEIVAPGYKYNMTDIAAAIGIHQLRRADELHEKRRNIAALYTRLLGEVEELILPSELPNRIHSWHLYVIRLRLKRLKVGRAQVIQELKARGIGTSVHWLPLHMHPYYRETYGYQAADLPVAAGLYPELTTLPLYPNMTEAEVEVRLQES